LRRMGIEWRDRRLIANLYFRRVRVRIDEGFSEPGNMAEA